MNDYIIYTSDPAEFPCRVDQTMRAYDFDDVLTALEAIVEDNAPDPDGQGDTTFWVGLPDGSTVRVDVTVDWSPSALARVVDPA